MVASPLRADPKDEEKEKDKDRKEDRSNEPRDRGDADGVRGESRDKETGPAAARGNGSEDYAKDLEEVDRELAKAVEERDRELVKAKEEADRERKPEKYDEKSRDINAKYAEKEAKVINKFREKHGHAPAVAGEGARPERKPVPSDRSPVPPTDDTREGDRATKAPPPAPRQESRARSLQRDLGEVEAQIAGQKKEHERRMTELRAAHKRAVARQATQEAQRISTLMERQTAAHKKKMATLEQRRQSLTTELDALEHGGGGDEVSSSAGGSRRTLVDDAAADPTDQAELLDQLERDIAADEAQVRE
jgi:hypothetical protein